MDACEYAIKEWKLHEKMCIHNVAYICIYKY